MKKNKIVIDGYSCRLPKSDNPQQFWQNLISGQDMLTDEGHRWENDYYKLPPRFGKLNDISRFDAQFFEVHSKQAHAMDPQLRLLLEVSYEAILNSARSPYTLRGTNTGVFVGACFSDAHALASNEPDKLIGYENTGCSLSMFANRLSYFFDFHGPSETIDTACSSSLVAFDAAVRAIQDGRCDYALVGGANMVLSPKISMGFKLLQMLSPDGECKSFDADGNGYTRAEGIVALLLTKESLARRKYANVLGTAVNNDGYTTEGITFPSGQSQKQLLNTVYQEVNVDPMSVSYIEAHGTGTQAGDPQEVNALDDIFCDSSRNNENPLLIGSVKSNMGHAEGASGLAGILKVLLAMQHNTLPPNLHFNTPNPNIHGLIDGRIKVVTEPTPWNGGIVGINSFGFGGTNAHVIIEGGNIPAAETTNCESSFGDLDIIPFSTRTAGDSDQIQEHFKSAPIEASTAAFMRGISSTSAKNFPIRGYALSTKGNIQSIAVGKNSSESRPVCFVFPGMGAQWSGMGADLMQVASFRNAIEACHTCLTDKDIDLINLIKESTDTTFDNTTNAFVGLTAIQIALVDTLKAAGINPDVIIGHSVGEIACGYADGGLTREQAILSAYWRGICVEEYSQSTGKMAALEMTWDEAKSICPEGVVAACHNSEHSVTVSGDAKVVSELVTTLQNNGGDAREVRSSGIAFHSPLIQSAAPKLLEALQGVIPTPNVRSKRWICTSRPESEWENAQDCSADYFVDNLVNPVLFYEGLKHLPENAIVIEIAAHTLMRATLMDVLGPGGYIGLMRRDYSGTHTLLEGLGQAYMKGINVAWNALLPSPALPSNVPNLPQLVHWDHTQEWHVPNIEQLSSNGSSAAQTYTIDLKQDDQAYIADHVVNDHIVFPGMGYIDLVWKSLARLHKIPFNNLPVKFESVSFLRITPLNPEETLDLSVSYLPTTGQFEITNESDIVASGKAFVLTDEDLENNNKAITDHINSDSVISLDTGDIYKELTLRGYRYGPHFQRINSVTMDGNNIKINWDGNWVTYLDSLLHANVVRFDRKTMVPTHLRLLEIDPGKLSTDCMVTATSDPFTGRIQSPGIVIEGLKFSPMSRSRQRNVPALREMHFVPYFEEDCVQKENAYLIHEYLQVTDSYICHRFHKIIEQCIEKSIDIPQHIERLKSVMPSKESIEAPSDELVEKFLNLPDTYLLRLAKHFFDHGLTVLSDAMPTIFSYEDYYKLYKLDIGAAYFYGRHLGSMIDTVIENTSVQSPLTICEVGAGTGGLAHHILPRLRNSSDRYILTDISAGFFGKLKDEFSDYNSVTQYSTWDISQAAPSSIPASADLVMASNVIHATDDIRAALNNIHDYLADDGFLLLHEPTAKNGIMLGIWGFIEDLWSYSDQQDRSHGALTSRSEWMRILSETGFDVVSMKDDGELLSLFLCRKRPKQPYDTSLVSFSENNIDSILPLMQQKMEEVVKNDNARLWVQGSPDTATGIIGMINSARKEPDGERLRCLYLEDNRAIDDAELELLYRYDLAVNVRRNGQWGAYRYQNAHPHEQSQASNALMSIGVKGDLSTLHWSNAADPGNHDNIYHVCYCSLNFKDIMLATGKLPENAFEGPMATALGGEFSGITENGRRIMGFLNDTLTTKVYATPEIAPCIFDVPEDWSLEEAATVPVVYMTAYLALLIRARLKPGERILIHSGTGGVGQAAIRIALAMGCEVFTTVGTDEKRAFLKEEFPDLPEDHIGSSRDTSFEDMVMKATNGKGVNVVLNSLADDKLKASLRLLARYGRFVEIGKFDMSQDTSIGMEMFLKDITFCGVGLNNVMLDNPETLSEIYQLMAKGISSGVVQPLPRSVFNYEELEQAFRYMAKGKHIGKVLVRVQDGKNTTPTYPVNGQMFWCNPSKSYLITGGLGGFGLELAEWLVNRGARRLILTSRSGIKTGYQAYRKATWEEKGVDVVVSKHDIASKDDTKRLLEEIESKNPLGGVFHLAMVMDDALFFNQSSKSFQNACAAKLNGARHLDVLTRDLSPGLETFVVFSSIVGSLGNPGQTNYGYANFGMDRICEERKKQGFPALAIQWGAIGDVGFVQENKDYVDLSSLFIEEQSIPSCLEALDKMLNQDNPVIASYIMHNAVQAIADSADSDSTNQVLTLDSLMSSIKNILGLNKNDDINDSLSLNELGMDSLMAVEIRHVLETGYNIRVPLPEIRTLTFSRLQELFNQTSITNSSELETTSDNESVAAEESKHHSKDVFELVTDIPDGKEVLYFVDGILSDSQHITDTFQASKDSSIYIVRYGRAGSMGNLTDLWANHISALPDKVSAVKIVGYSAGAVIALRFAKLLEEKNINIQPEVISISPPKRAMFKLLDGFTNETLDIISENEGMERLKQTPMYGDFSMLPFEEIKDQMRFIIDDHFYEKELASADLMVLPSEDEVCWDQDQAKKHAVEVKSVDGMHDLRSLPLTEIVNRNLH